MLDSSYFNDNFESFDGLPCPEGMVLAPLVIDPVGDYTRRNPEFQYIYLRHLRDLPFYFFCYPVTKEKYTEALRFHYQELSRILDPIRAGRCVLTELKDGSRIPPRLCPKTRRCEDCNEKDKNLRFNPKNQKNFLSLDAAFNKGDDSMEQAYLALRFEELLKYLAGISPKYAFIILSLARGESKKSIIEKLHLKKTEGYHKIHEAQKLGKEFWHSCD